MAEADVQLDNFPNLFSLEGRVAVVTGGSRGIGLHAASGLLQAGCSKIFITSRKAAGCNEAVAALNALAEAKNLRGKAFAVPADSSKVSEIEMLVKEVGKETDHVDILFANAGAIWGATLEETDEKNGWDKVMDINLKGVFFTVQKFLPLLQHSASLDYPSRILITASVAGLAVGSIGERASYSYAASKSAVIHLARNLAIELGPRRILVNCIAPGFFPSKLANWTIEQAGGVEAMGKLNPNGRVGKAEDIAGVVVFLASRAGSHINADTIVLDGGGMVGQPLTKL